MKNRVKVSVDGKSFTLVGEETEEHMRQVAAYIDEKMAEVRGNAAAVTMDSSLAYVLTSMNVADDYFKEREYTAELEGRIIGLTARLRELNQKLEDAEGAQAVLVQKLAEAERLQAETAQKLAEAEHAQAEAAQKLEWAEKGRSRAEDKLNTYRMEAEANAAPEPHYARARAKNRKK